MKKFLAVLAVLAFLFVAGPVSADWISDLPIPNGVISVAAKYRGDIGVITIETESGSCMEYKVVDEEIAEMRKCGDTAWKDFIKK